MKSILSPLVVVGLSILLLSGCRQTRPDDLPTLYSCKVTIQTKDGTPVEDATVSLISPDSKWAALGNTKSDGSVQLKTHAMYKGVSAGKYKVTVTKYGEGIPGKEGEEQSLFDPSFASEDTTPLEFTVEAKNDNEATFNVF